MSMIIAGSTRGVWPPNIGPLTEIQPFTYEDALTYTDVLGSMKKYIKFVLVPYLETVVGELNEINAGVITAITDKLEEQTADVVAKLEAQDAANDVKIADLETYVNEQIQLIINDSIQVQDPVVAGMVNDDESQTRTALDTKYAGKSLEGVVTSIQGDIVELGEEIVTSEERVTKYPVFNLSSDTLRRSNIAFGRAAAGGEPFRICVVGDSTGQGFENVQKSFPTFLINSLRRRGIPTLPGIIAPAKSIPDARWAALGGWDLSNVIGPAGGTWRSEAGNPNALFYQPLEEHTSISMHYVVQATGGKFKVDHVGTVLGIVDTSVGTPNTYTKTTWPVTGGTVDAAGAISEVVDGPVNILGFEYLNTAYKHIATVSNLSQNGVSAQDWADISLSLKGIEYVKPDLTYVLLGINDSQELRPTNVFIDKIDNIVNTAKLSGDVVLIAFPESQPDVFGQPTTALQAEYLVALDAYAKANAIPYFDFNLRSGGYSNYTTNPWYRDPVHQSTDANGTIAEVLANILVS